LVLRPEAQRSQRGKASEGSSVTEANGHIIYYSTHLNSSYFEHAQDYYGIAKYKTKNPSSFPVGAIALKAAWRVATEEEIAAAAPGSKKADKPDFLFIDAHIEDTYLGADENKIPSGTTIGSKKVILVGLHIAGVINGHPDFVWATFEHDRNAPNLLLHDEDNVRIDDDDIVSHGDFTFYKSGTPAGRSNKRGGKDGTNIVRRYKFGGAPPKLATDIVASNKHFKGILKTSQSIPPTIATVSDLFADYHLVGAVWKETPPKKRADKGSPKKGADGAPPKREITGSTSLTNSVIDTYVQARGNNCFTCHNSSGYQVDGTEIFPPKEINYSHAILAPFLEE